MNENPATKSESISTSNVDRHNNDTKILEFMQDLKEAIQNGEFQRCEQQEELKSGEPSKATQNEADQEQSTPIASIANLINVNNLSNQTFNYIINWLKQQQLQQLEENKV